MATQLTTTRQFIRVALEEWLVWPWPQGDVK